MTKASPWVCLCFDLDLEELWLDLCDVHDASGIDGGGRGVKARGAENFEFMLVLYIPFPLFLILGFDLTLLLGTWTCHVKFRVRLVFLDLALK